jgi:nucleolar protein 58
VSPFLATFLDPLKEEKKASLAVADPKLANAIKKIPGLSITPISDSSTDDLFRALREHLPSLIADLTDKELRTMSLGLSHSLSRHKLKFSPDKVDTMIIHAVGLLDDIDKELNQYAMRLKEWYGWHFPEMAKIINDNLAYARVVNSMGVRAGSQEADLSHILPEEVEHAVKHAAEISMGTDITEEDFEEIKSLAENVIGLYEYRQTLSSYLSSRMQALAPSLTHLVGEVVGARMVAHAGSLMALTKNPASTIQVLGAEKALFRALKTKHDTPKYGLIYHASLIGQATGKNKGKIARMLAAKAALGIRIDVLSPWGILGSANVVEPTDEEKLEFAQKAHRDIERKLRNWEGKSISKGATIAPVDQPTKFSIKEARKYNPDADGLTGDEPAAKEIKLNGSHNGSTAAKVEAAKLVEDYESSDEEDEETEHVQRQNGSSTAEADKKSQEKIKAAEKAAKKAAKEAKALRKAERAAKRAAKEERKLLKQLKETSKVDGEDATVENGEISKKKRKREEAEGDGEKKKKKKSSKI